MGVAAVEVGFGQFGVGLDDLVVFGDGFFDFAAVVQFDSGFQWIFNLARPGRNRTTGEPE